MKTISSASNIISFQEAKQQLEANGEDAVYRVLPEEQRMNENEQVIEPLLVSMHVAAETISFAYWFKQSNPDAQDVDNLLNMASKTLRAITDEFLAYIESTLSTAPAGMNHDMDYWSERTATVMERIPPLQRRAEKVYQARGWTEEEYENAVEEAVDENDDVFTLLIDLITIKIDIGEASDRLSSSLMADWDANIIPPAVKREWETLFMLAMEAEDELLIAICDVVETFYEHEEELTEEELAEIYGAASHLVEISTDIADSIWAMYDEE